MTRLEEITIGNHILAIYPDSDSMIEEAFKFLKQGLDNDENIMIVTDLISRAEIRRRMNHEWNVNVESMELGYSITIRTTQEWYYNQDFNEPDKMKAIWKAMNEIARVRGKKGLRLFADTHDFFEKGYEDDLVKYEACLDLKFDFNFTSICAYDSKDIESLSSSQRDALFEHHTPIWK